MLELTLRTWPHCRLSTSKYPGINASVGSTTPHAHWGIWHLNHCVWRVWRAWRVNEMWVYYMCIFGVWNVHRFDRKNSKFRIVWWATISRRRYRRRRKGIPSNMVVHLKSRQLWYAHTPHTHTRRTYTETMLWFIRLISKQVEWLRQNIHEMKGNHLRNNKILMSRTNEYD